jgi:hypothetical protein
MREEEGRNIKACIRVPGKLVWRLFGAYDVLCSICPYSRVSTTSTPLIDMQKPGEGEEKEVARRKREKKGRKKQEITVPRSRVLGNQKCQSVSFTFDASAVL